MRVCVQDSPVCGQVAKSRNLELGPFPPGKNLRWLFELQPPSRPTSISITSPLPSIPSRDPSKCSAGTLQAVATNFRETSPTDPTALHSGIARSLRASARRPATLQRAFQPIKPSFAPALSQRFASTASNTDGRVHQVIGAVVDGMRKPFPHDAEAQAPLPPRHCRRPHVVVASRAPILMLLHSQVRR